MRVVVMTGWVKIRGFLRAYVYVFISIDRLVR
jgi:hypothetical protein